MSENKRYIILESDGMVVRDTETGINLHLGSFEEALTLMDTLNGYEDFVKEARGVVSAIIASISEKEKRKLKKRGISNG